jgi:hypothetical protein
MLGSIPSTALHRGPFAPMAPAARAVIGPRRFARMAMAPIHHIAIASVAAAAAVRSVSVVTVASVLLHRPAMTTVAAVLLHCKAVMCPTAAMIRPVRSLAVPTFVRRPRAARTGILLGTAVSPVLSVGPGRGGQNDQRCTHRRVSDEWRSLPVAEHLVPPLAIAVVGGAHSISSSTLIGVKNRARVRNNSFSAYESCQKAFVFAIFYTLR